MDRPRCDFAPLITGITPVYRPTQWADKDYAEDDPITIIHAFIVEGHHLGKVTKDDISLGNFTRGYRWRVIDAETLDPCRILVHASLECIKPEFAAAGAGSGDLTITVNSPPPPPPPPPPHGPGKKRKEMVVEEIQARVVENAFTVYYIDDSVEE
jgi:hypothetical protein